MLLSIIQGLFKSKQNTTRLNVRAKDQKEAVNDLLFEYTPFIKKTASYICKRQINEQDEEFSISLQGFHEALMAYNEEKNASLETFAHLVIKRRLLDFLRKESTRKEQLVEFENQILEERSLHRHAEEEQAASRREELLKYKELLAEYKLSFEELTSAAPKHADSRRTAFQIAQIISESEELYASFIAKKKLPLKDIEALVGVSRKTLERHRKYMIAVILLLKSDFVYIKDYVKGEII